MGTRKLASLMKEYKIPEEPEKVYWRRLGYTHAVSYEEALDKLLPKLSRHWGLPHDTRYSLVWGYAPKYDDVIDITPAVLNRLKKIEERRAKKVKA